MSSYSLVPWTQAPLVANSTTWTELVTQNSCKLFRIRETGNAASTGFLIAAPNQSSGPKTYSKGDIEDFVYPGTGQWPPNNHLGWIKTTDLASASFDILEM